VKVLGDMEKKVLDVSHGAERREVARSVELLAVEAVGIAGTSSGQRARQGFKSLRR